MIATADRPIANFVNFICLLQWVALPDLGMIDPNFGGPPTASPKASFAALRAL